MQKFTLKDIKQIQAHGISLQEVERQLQFFRRGMKPIRLYKAAKVGDGIVQLPEESFDELMDYYTTAAKAGRLMKFVPASGAATRMFKDLIELFNRSDSLNSNNLQKWATFGDATAASGREFFQNLNNFAFFNTLSRAMKNDGYNINRLLKEEKLRLILKYLLTDKGLNYAETPKGLIEFHRYGNVSRTPFAEHIVEAGNLTMDDEAIARIHFTIPENHMNRIKEHIEAMKKELSDYCGVERFEVTYSIQQKSTDNIAVDMNNQPFRDEEGNLVFRPGGHGSLIYNLNQIGADIVFINNIDNVRLDELKGDTYKFRRLLCGCLIKLQERLFEYVYALNNNSLDDDQLEHISQFYAENFNPYFPPKFKNEQSKERQKILLKLLNRPLRICGMVKNHGDPGGGPFWVISQNEAITKQIVEMAQIDMDDETQMQIVKSSTHFNPVDIVCGLRNYKGENFDLLKYIDQETAFITTKFHNGRKLKALERPGLWNGAMAFWNTLFVEVPATTFSPVKKVNDLLKEPHQGKEKQT